MDFHREHNGRTTPNAVSTQCGWRLTTEFDSPIKRKHFAQVLSTKRIDR
jgi:hypothetical protein